MIDHGSSAGAIQIRKKFDDTVPQLAQRLKIFFRRRCKDSNEASRVDDWVQETLFRVMQKVESGVEILSVEAYAMGTAKMVFQEYLNHRVINSSTEPGAGSPEDLMALIPDSRRETQAACLDQCLLQLEEPNRALVLSWFAEPSGGAKIDRHRQLTEQLAQPSSTVRVRVFRLVQKLRSCCRDCVERETKSDL